VAFAKLLWHLVIIVIVVTVVTIVTHVSHSEWQSTRLHFNSSPMVTCRVKVNVRVKVRVVLLGRVDWTPTRVNFRPAPAVMILRRFQEISDEMTLSRSFCVYMSAATTNLPTLQRVIDWWCTVCVFTLVMRWTRRYGFDVTNVTTRELLAPGVECMV